MNNYLKDAYKAPRITKKQLRNTYKQTLGTQFSLKNENRTPGDVNCAPGYAKFLLEKFKSEKGANLKN